MVNVLKKEQADDEHKKAYCGSEFDQSDDKKKEFEQALADDDAAIASAEEGIAGLRGEIAALEDAIKALDKAVADATEQRQGEHAAYEELLASDSAAKKLLGWAKDRLN